MAREEQPCRPLSRKYKHGCGKSYRKWGRGMGKYPIPAAVDALCAALRGAGYRAYPVGGCVRDLLLGLVPGDWDVTTSALPQEVMDLFPRTVPTGIAHGTVTVLEGEEKVEVTTFRREGDYADARHPAVVSFDVGLTEDLLRRDFTINAMALDESGEIIDPFGGRADLTARLIRCVGEPGRRFAEDALRMLRAVRFAARLDFAIEEKTAAAIGANAGRAALLSGERVKAEVEKILLTPRPQRVAELIAAGVLDHLYAAWPDDMDLSTLAAAPPERGARWRAFCAATGFPIRALPVERALRRAVEHPELEILAGLKLTGGQLCALGLAGPEVGAAQRYLAAHVLHHPEDNEYEILLALAGQWVEQRRESMP